MRNDALLLGFAMGTFHAVLLTLALVLSLYLAVDLGEALGSLNTAIGLAVFAALWTTSVYCTYRGMVEAGLGPGGVAPAGRVFKSAEQWGAWTGMAFFWLLSVGLLIAGLVVSIAEGGDALAGVLVFGFSAVALGTVVSAIVGVALGTLFAVLDMGLVWAGRVTSGVAPGRVGGSPPTD